MRTSLTFTALAASLSMMCLQGARAADNTVPANRESAIGFITGVSSNCQTAAKPKMRVVEAPQHGNVRFQWTKYKINGISRLCDGKPAWGMAIHYRPAAGYKGKDHFIIGTTLQRYENGTGTQYKQNSVDLVVK